MKQFNPALALNPVFGYLKDEDRYLTAFPEPKYRFNLIGGGIIAQEHLRVTLFEGRATIHGVYDPNPRSVTACQQNMAQYAPNQTLTVYDSLEAACNDPAVDGLIICTPNYTHIDVAPIAAASGKHILLEKPIATTVADAKTIMEIAEAYEAVFQVGLQYRFKPQYTEALHEILERKTIGAVKTINMTEHRIPFLDKVNQWNKFAQFSGDTLVEKCCHYFDLINTVAQSKPKTVYAVGGQAVNFTEFERDGRQSDIMDNSMVIITYENGVTANFNLCMFAPMFYEELVVCGDEGRLKTTEYEDFLPHDPAVTQLEILAHDDRPSRLTRPMYPSLIQKSGHQGGTYIEHIEFVNQIEGKPSRAASAREGYWSVVVAAAAQQSIATGQPVHIDEYVGV